MFRPSSLIFALLLTGCGSDIRAQVDLGTRNFTPGLSPAATPTFTPGAGTYSSTQSVNITTADAPCLGDMVYNTTGAQSGGNLTGTTPVSGAVSVATTQTLYAQVQGCIGHSNSAIGSAAYTISGGCTPPTMTYRYPSVISGSVSSWTDVVAGNNATNSNPTYQPTYTSNAFGGNPGLVFVSASFLNLELNTGISTSTTHYAGYAVIVPTASGSGGGGIVGNKNGADVSFGIAGSGTELVANVWGNPQYTSSAFMTPGDPYFVGFDITATTMTLYHCTGGTCSSIGTDSISGFGGVSGPLQYIGAGGLGYLDGTLVEVGLLAGAGFNTTTTAAYQNCAYPGVD